MKKVCLVGCGHIGRVHAGLLRGRVALGFCSRRRQSAEKFRAEFGGEQVYGDYEEALADAALDAVVLCSPPEAHAGQVVQALQAGKGVLVEKPLCATQAELALLDRAVAEHPGTLLMVAENYYYKPSLRWLKQMLEENAIGPLRRVELRKCFTQEAAGWKSGYGALLEGGIHFVALLSALFEQEPSRVEAEFPGRSAPAPERHSILHLEYEGGARASLHYAWNAPSLLKGLFQHSRLEGEEGHIVFESNGLYAFVRSPRRRGLRFPGFGDLMGYRAMAADFLRCLEQGGRPYSDFARARRDLQIVFAAYRTL